MSIFARLAAPEFYEPTLLGLTGLAGNLLFKRLNPVDATVTGKLHKVFTDRIATLAFSVLSHLILCLLAFEANQLNVAAAIFAGWFNQEILTAVMENLKARQVARLTGAPYPPDKGGES